MEKSLVTAETPLAALDREHREAVAEYVRAEYELRNKRHEVVQTGMVDCWEMDLLVERRDKAEKRLNQLRDVLLRMAPTKKRGLSANGC